MRIERLEIRHLWSFGTPDGVLVQHFDNINVVIGRNNVGKSNLVRGIKWARDNQTVLANEESTYLPHGSEIFLPGMGEIICTPTLRTTFSFEIKDWQDVTGHPTVEKLVARDPSILRCQVSIGFALSDRATGQCKPFVTVHHDYQGKDRFSKCCEGVGVAEADATAALGKAAVPRLADRLVPLSGWRSLKDPITAQGNLCVLLDELKRAIIDENPKRKLFNQVEQFFWQLTGLHGAQIDPRKDGQGLNVTSNGRTLPLTSFGDGITHLLLMAAHAALHPDCVIVVEEPETHLHPHLQRHLLQFLAGLPSTQVVITTHSPVLLDSKLVKQVIRVEHDGERSVVKPILGLDPEVSLKQLYAILDDIGARPSDVLQANVVIWVEGPSDRVFLKHCLKLIAPELVEGLHYQIVFYGGALRAHLTFGKDVELFVNLLKLSRTAAMVCDSDSVKAGDELNDTKKRLKAELDGFGGFYWVTFGREIENYIPDRVLSRAYKQLLQDEAIEISLDQHERLDDAVGRIRQQAKDGDKWKTHYGQHKVDLMRVFTENMFSADDLDRFDLKAQLDRLVRVISRANEIKIRSIS